MLPIVLQMQIDLMAADAKRAVAEGFSAARERLLPEPARKQMTWDEWNGCHLMGVDAFGVANMLGMDLPGQNPLTLQQALAADPRALDWTHCYNNAAGLENTADPWGAYNQASANHWLSDLFG